MLPMQTYSGPGQHMLHGSASAHAFVNTGDAHGRRWHCNKSRPRGEVTGRRVAGDDETALAGLLRAALAGDEAAYSQFLQRVSRSVRALARRKLGDGTGVEPEDIVQETLLAIHAKRHTWRTDQPVMPWFYAIARYKIVDAYRRRGRAIVVDIDDFADRLEAEQPETASDHEIAKALDGLSEGQRKVVRAISVEGRSIAETARDFGMKETAVRVALHRGLAAIAQRFGRTET